MLALTMSHVIIRDREATDPDACFIAHADCADRVVVEVNEEFGYARLYVYGPTTVNDTCAVTDCTL